MQVTLPFVYAIDYIPARARNKRHVYRDGVLHAELREVGRSEISQVARFRNHKEKFHGDRILPDPGKNAALSELVFFENSHWIEWGDAEAFISQTLSEEGGNGTSLKQVLGGYKKASSDKAVSDVMRNSYSMRLLDDRENDTREKILATLEDMIVVDGRLFQKSSEPTLHLRKDYSGHLSVCVGPPHLPGYERSNSFNAAIPRQARLDQLPEMMQVFEAAGVEVECACDVVDPDPQFLFQAPARRNALDSAHKSAQSLRSGGACLPKIWMAGFLELRDALTCCEDTMTPRLHAALCAITQLPDLDPDFLLPHKERHEQAQFQANLRPYGGRPEAGSWQHLDSYLSAAREHANAALKAMEFDFAGETQDLQHADCFHYADGRRLRVLMISEEVAGLAKMCGLDVPHLVRQWRSGEEMCQVEVPDARFSDQPHRWKPIGMLVDKRSFSPLPGIEGEAVEVLPASPQPVAGFD